VGNVVFQDDDASHHFLSQLKVSENAGRSEREDRRSLEADGAARGRKRQAAAPLEETAANRRKSSKPRKIARTLSNGSNAGTTIMSKRK